MRVWCWSDLWQAVRDAHDDGPALLSAAALRAAVDRAVDAARRADELSVTRSVAHWPGFRRRVRDQIHAWTRLELDPRRDPPDDDPRTAELWAIFGRYRAILNDLEVEDSAGYAAWASHVLRDGPPPAFRRLAKVTILDLDDDGPAARRALECFEQRAKAVTVTLGYDHDPALTEVYAAVAPLRERLIERGYVEEAWSPDLLRPGGLRAVERELFRDDAHARPRLTDGSGLALLGGPEGEGLGLLVAREVRRRLVDDRTCPEDVLVLVRAWDASAEAVYQTLQSWRLPVSAVGRPRRLGSAPAVAALLTAMRLPVDEYETAALVRLMRHGQFQPAGTTAESRADAAAVVRDLPVFRGRDAIRAQFDDRVRDARDDHERGRVVAARELTDRVIAAVEPLAVRQTWRAHRAAVLRAAATLGLGDPADDALERLADLLADAAHVHEGAGRGEVAYEKFRIAVERLVNEEADEDATPRPGTVAMAVLDRAAGARAAVVLLADLVEGTFPTREAVEADDSGRAYARELWKFLRVLGAADERVVLAYPTRDEKGQELLPAGFLDDLRRRLAPEALAAVVEEHVRLDPALVDRPDLAVAPTDARARAVALAYTRDDPDELARLAAERSHRRALEGVARALLVANARRSRKYTPYDGRLAGPAIAAAMAARFGPDAPFSASMLESYLTCPFQFFLKYVLGLMPVDDREEFEEDYVGRGNRVHEMLENLERTLKEGGDRLEIATVLFQTEMDVELTVDSGVDAGRHLIDRRRLERTLRQYVDQAKAYEARAKGQAVRPVGFEVAFGARQADAAHPPVRIGEGPDSVLIQGKIDRIDVIDTDDGPRFRVIDYKTGSTPSTTDVRNHQMVQLPLYALAVERLELTGGATGLLDVGYWGLRADGFKPIALKDWAAHREQLEAAVIEAAARLRRGVFDVFSRKDHCTQYCDYGSACRIHHVRNVGKSPEEGPA